MKRPRPLTMDQRQRTVTALTELAAELDRPDAGRTQQLIATLLDEGYTTTASGAAPTGNNGGGGDTVLTIVEAKAARPDPAAGDALLLALRLQRIARDTDEVLRALRSLRSDRPVATCPEGHVLDRTAGGGKRCQYVDPETGRRCGTSQGPRTCENPYCMNKEGTGPRAILPGQKRRYSVAVDLGGIEVGECERCSKSRQRTGRSWGDATRLAPGSLGAYSSDDPWPEVG